MNYIEDEKHPYQAGDLLLLYTDGIIESKNEKGETYDYDRLKRFVDLNHELPLKQFQGKLIKEIRQFSKDDRLDDDYTILMVRFIK